MNIFNPIQRIFPGHYPYGYTGDTNVGTTDRSITTFDQCNWVNIPQSRVPGNILKSLWSAAPVSVANGSVWRQVGSYGLMVTSRLDGLGRPMLPGYYVCAPYTFMPGVRGGYGITSQPRFYPAQIRRVGALPTIVQPGQTKTMGTIEGAAIGAFAGGILGLLGGLLMKNTGLGSTVGTLTGAAVGGAIGYSQASGSAATAAAANSNAAASGLNPPPSGALQGSVKGPLPGVAGQIGPVYPPITQPNPVISVAPGSSSDANLVAGNSLILQLPAGSTGASVTSTDQTVIANANMTGNPLTVPTRAAGVIDLTVSTTSPWTWTATVHVTVQ